MKLAQRPGLLSLKQSQIYSEPQQEVVAICKRIDNVGITELVNWNVRGNRYLVRHRPPDV